MVLGPSSVASVRAAQPADSRAIAELMVACFPREFSLLFGRRREAAVAVVEQVVGLEGVGGAQALVAQDSGSVIGMLLLECEQRARITKSRAAMWQLARDQVGLGHLPRLLLGLALLSHQVKAGEAYISALGVASSARRRGWATRLLQEAEAWARARGMTCLGLHVNSDNVGARSLYQRLGFEERGVQTRLFASLLLGEPPVIYMTKPLGPLP